MTIALKYFKIIDEVNIYIPKKIKVLMNIVSNNSTLNLLKLWKKILRTNMFKNYTSLTKFNTYKMFITFFN